MTKIIKFKRKKPAEMTQHDKMCEQIKIWVDLNEKRFPFLECFYHIPNEGKRNPSWAHKIGIKGGLPDYNLPVENDMYNGFWLEIKKPGDTPTLKQRLWIKRLRKYGHQAEWTDSLKVAFMLLETYCKGVTIPGEQGE